MHEHTQTCAKSHTRKHATLGIMCIVNCCDPALWGNGQVQMDSVIDGVRRSHATRMKSLKVHVRSNKSDLLQKLKTCKPKQQNRVLMKTQVRRLITLK